MGVDPERAAWVALAMTPAIGPERMKHLIDACGSATGALAAPVAFLGTVPKMTLAAATAVSQASAEGGAAVIARAEAMGATVLLPRDPGFPELLEQIGDMPPVLFALGNLALLERPAVAIVGSRDHSAYGETVADRVGRMAASAGLVVVSGMARGLDAVAHAAALEVGGGSIGVLGNGLGVIYPAANRRLYQRMAEQGLLLTEFPPGERPQVHTFPRRNRLISGLARVTVVVEAAEGSGTMSTVDEATRQGRTVMAVPGPITSKTSVGTNRLLRDGAQPLLEPLDLLEHYPEHRRLAGTPLPVTDGAPVRAARPVPIPDDLPPSEHRLAVALQGGAEDFDGLIRLAGLTATDALAALSGLELRGLIRQDPGRVEWARN